jgi:unsaturated rhamnogalacturonyl hydrolase
LYEVVKEKDMSDSISDMLTELLRALYSFQQDNNMLRQLPLSDNVRNYDETSGTALYSYSAIKASNMNITDEFLKSGINALESIADNYISEIENEIPVLKNICLVAGLGGENNRNGSAEYYLSEQVVENDAKGIAPFIMAYTEYRKSKSR